MAAPATGTAAAPLSFRRAWLAIGWACVAVVVFLSLTPDPLPPGELLGFDYAHAFTYAWLMFWFAQLYARPRGPAIALALCALGVGLEVAQGWTGYRTLSYADMRDDAIGVALGWALAGTRAGALLPRIDARLARAASR